MIEVFRRLLIAVTIIFCVVPALLASEGKSDESGGAPINVVGTVSNHNELEYPGGNLPLPRILLVNGHWYAYGSTESAVESGKFTKKNDVLVPADGSSISLDLSITSHLIYVWLSILISLIIIFVMVGRYKKGNGRKTEPKGWFQNIFEAVFVFIRDNVAKNNMPEDKYRKFVPFLFSVFVVITFMNLFSLVPWGATATADITVTGVLALISFVITQWNATKDHWEHVFWFPGVPGWVRIILTPIEFLGLFTKPFALAIRLYANMLSGKIMIICILGLIFVFADLFGHTVGWATSIIAVPLTVSLFILKAFISVLQAYIFTLLSAVFIGMAADEHELHEETVEAHA